MQGQNVVSRWIRGTLLLLLCAGLPTAVSADEVDAATLAEQIGIERGICVLVGSERTSLPVELARHDELTIYAQFASPEQVAAARQAADAAGLLGSRVYVERGNAAHIHLADNLADVVVAPGAAAEQQEEILRVLRPGGKALLGEQELLKSVPPGVDDWSHPYHGPDNNPQSTDTVARGPYLTQFLATPWYGPMPEITVAAGGRLFKAFGHISFKRREQPLVNMLVAVNAYNGTELWRRPLREGFMIHRATMIATPDVLFLGDDQSCKMIDGATGRLLQEIVPEEATAERTWKWMAKQDHVLYAMLGPVEQTAVPLRGTRTAPGWPWTGLGQGYGQQNYPWGFGNTILAIDLSDGRVLWSHQEEQPLDSRATCMSDGRIFFYSHANFLGCLDATTGQLQWKTDDAPLLEAIGQHDRAQHWTKGFSSTSYAKCTKDAIYFAGPQRTNLVAVSARDGTLLWQYPHGNYQLVLRDDALYALGRLDKSFKFDLLTGEVLADLECFRGNCTRATATIDSIFSRGHEHTGTQRILLDGDRSTRIGLMRPACQDGVLVAGGLLYWGPWMCDCNLQLVGIISLGPAGDFKFGRQAVASERLESAPPTGARLAEPQVTASDWPTYRGNNARQSGSHAVIARSVTAQWQFEPAAATETTAAVAVGKMVFVGGADGVVRALDAASGQERWKAYTGGRIFYPPAVWQGRVYAGSGDGHVYAWSARDGRLLWRFRVAPVERRIPVYGHLSSTWPVASGVLVDEGVVYAAAGIASYDGTHVVALDARSGKIRWQNNTSGRLAGDDLVTGVSVQGHLLLHDERLYMAGGNVVSPAMFNTRTGECLNRVDEWQKAPRGRELFLIGDDVHVFDRLLYSPLEDQLGRYYNKRFVQAARGDVLVRGRTGQIMRITAASQSGNQPQGLWESRALQRIDALAVAANVVVATGQAASSQDGTLGDFVVTAFSLADGKPLWSHRLPAAAASWGLALDRDGRVLVTLEDGRLICFGN